MQYAELRQPQAELHAAAWSHAQQFAFSPLQGQLYSCSRKLPYRHVHNPASLPCCHPSAVLLSLAAQSIACCCRSRLLPPRPALPHLSWWATGTLSTSWMTCCTAWRARQRCQTWSPSSAQPPLCRYAPLLLTSFLSPTCCMRTASRNYAGMLCVSIRCVVQCSCFSLFANFALTMAAAAAVRLWRRLRWQ
mgnify:CR=1 FL=1